MSSSRLPLGISHLFSIHCKDIISRIITSEDINQRIVVNGEIIKITTDNLSTYVGTTQDVINAMSHSTDNTNPLYCTEYILQDEAGKRIGDSTTFALAIIPDVAIAADVGNGDILTYQGGYWVNQAPPGVGGIVINNEELSPVDRKYNITIASTTDYGVSIFATSSETSSTTKLATPKIAKDLIDQNLTARLVVGSNLPNGQWYLDSESTVRTCGSAIVDVSDGSHIIHFKDVDGYDTPADITVSTVKGSTSTAFGEYTTDMCKVSIACGADSVTWSIDGGTTELDGLETKLVERGTTINYTAYLNTNPSNVISGSFVLESDTVIIPQW